MTNREKADHAARETARRRVAETGREALIRAGSRWTPHDLNLVGQPLTEAERRRWRRAVRQRDTREAREAREAREEARRAVRCDWIDVGEPRAASGSTLYQETRCRRCGSEGDRMVVTLATSAEEACEIAANERTGDVCPHAPSWALSTLGLTGPGRRLDDVADTPA